MIFYRPPGGFLRVISATARFLTAAWSARVARGWPPVGATMRVMPPEAEPIFEVGHGRWHEAVLERGWLMSSSPVRLPARRPAKARVGARSERRAAHFTALLGPITGHAPRIAQRVRIPVTPEGRKTRALTRRCPCAREMEARKKTTSPPGYLSATREAPAHGLASGHLGAVGGCGHVATPRSSPVSSRSCLTSVEPLAPEAEQSWDH
jgi:hypothetical protein